MRVGADYAIRINALNVSGGVVDGEPGGESKSRPMRLDFDCRLRLHFYSGQPLQSLFDVDRE